jgi:hypothetical protein
MKTRCNSVTNKLGTGSVTGVTAGTLMKWWGWGVDKILGRVKGVDYRTHPPSFLDKKRGGGYIFWRKK